VSGNERINRTSPEQNARWVYLIGHFAFWHAYSSREHDVLGSRRVDGQARVGSGQPNGSERVNRTSPEPSTLLVKVLDFFSYATRLSRRSLGEGESAARRNAACRKRIEPTGVERDGWASRQAEMSGSE
jgi:hypothetical protein